jgi:hypothetical protein
MRHVITRLLIVIVAIFRKMGRYVPIMISRLQEIMQGLLAMDQHAGFIGYEASPLTGGSHSIVFGIVGGMVREDQDVVGIDTVVIVSNMPHTVHGLDGVNGSVETNCIELTRPRRRKDWCQRRSQGDCSGPWRSHH